MGTRMISSLTAISARRRSVSSCATAMMKTLVNLKAPTAGAVQVFCTEVSAQAAKKKASEAAAASGRKRVSRVFIEKGGSVGSGGGCENGTGLLGRRHDE